MEKSIQHHNADVSFLKYKLGEIEDFILACRSGKHVGPERLDNAIAKKNALLALLAETSDRVILEGTTEMQRNEEDLLRQNRKE